MDAPLHSSRWYRVAARRPALRAHVELRRQHQRGVPWFVLIDHAHDRLLRLNATAHRFVGRCDGRTTVQQIWDELLATSPDDALTQDEALQLLIQLHERGLLQFDIAPDVETLFRAQAVKQRRSRRQGVNPLAFRLPLGDPSRLLASMDGLARVLYSPGMFVLWLLLVLPAAVAAAMHWPQLLPYAAKTLNAPGYLFLTWLLYPPIKLVHELAHGLAVQRFGGQVRQAGVTLLMLTPVPFVNASAADGFRHRHQRAAVSAAGIMAELALAALALGVWLVVEPGVVRDIAFLVMLIGAASTVLTNGNPLLRFDGYYLLCDLLDLRNLATRSARWWSHVLGRHVLGLRQPLPLETVPGETPWLVAYAPLSWLYRVALCVVIAMWIGSVSTAMGVCIVIFMVCTTLLQPLWRGWRHLQRSLEREGASARPLGRGALAAGTLAALVAAVPVPFGTVAEGVVWLPEQAIVRAGTDGFILRHAAADGQHVRAGDLLVVMDDERLQAERSARASEAVQLEVELFDALTGDPQHAPAIRERLAYARAEARRLGEKLEQLQVRAQADGVVVLPNQQNLQGAWRRQGDMLGHLLTGEAPTVRVALPQQDASLVRTRLHAVDVRLAEDGRAVRHGYAGRIRVDMPGAVDRLPSAALGDRSGGRIATDGDDKDGLTPRTPVVLMDVQVDAAPTTRAGARAWVRFDHGNLPLAAQALRGLQQLVLQQFNPAV